MKQQIEAGNNVGAWPDGVQVASEDDWDEQFGWAQSTGLRPSQLDPLEAIATRYLAALKQSSPDLEHCRTALLQALESAQLLNREFDNEGIYHQLQSTGHHNLKICIDNAECLYTYAIEADWTNCADIRQLPVVLDWVINAFDGQFPAEKLPYLYQSPDTFLARCIGELQKRSPTSIEPILFELAGRHIRLLLTWDRGCPKLANAEYAEEDFHTA